MEEIYNFEETIIDNKLINYKFLKIITKLIYFLIIKILIYFVGKLKIYIKIKVLQIYQI